LGCGNVLFQKLLFRVFVPGNHPELTQRININPGEVELARKKSGTGTARKEVMVIMPFTRKQSGSRLIYGEIASVEVDALAVLFLSSAVTGVIKSTDERKPE
jgi:hypothetical protein